MSKSKKKTLDKKLQKNPSIQDCKEKFKIQKNKVQKSRPLGILLCYRHDCQKKRILIKNALKINSCKL